MDAKPRKTKKLTREERRENALRPCAVLGYDRDALAVYLIERGAYPVAEALLRRAVWLNPYEPWFKAHLALCLYRQGRNADALACLAEVAEADKDEKMRTLVRLIEDDMSDKRAEVGE